MNEFIIANEEREDICVLSEKCSIDVDIGTDNDFQLTVPMSEYNPEVYKSGNYLYCIDTELGGILGDMEINTVDNTVIFTGDTPRGMMNKKVIEPPNGEDYRYARSPVGYIVSTLFSLYSFGDSLKAIQGDNSVVINERYDRYVTMLEGIKKVLAVANYKIEIKAEYDDQNKIVWNVYTVQVRDYSELIEISQDCNVDFKIKVKSNIYTHMICAGSGELQSRMIVHLYLQPDGTITEEQYYTGLKDKVYFYDYSSIEGENDEDKRANLIKAGKEKFSEINASDTQEMTFEGLELLGVNIGDIVGGREYMTGTTIKEPVSGIIYKYQHGTESTEIKVGETNG